MAMLLSLVCRDVVRKAKPSVVKVVSTKKTGERPLVSLGSGFLVSAQGHILTNHHVMINDEPTAN
jgi:S1-C subfamily serine protease